MLQPNDFLPKYLISTLLSMHLVKKGILEKNKVYETGQLHTVSFDWFLSGLEWILNLELYFTRNYNGISDLGLTLPHFEFLSLYLDMFDQNWSFVHKKWIFWSKMFKYRLKNSKCGRLKPRSDIQW